jgi:HPt (histidine-containing phosphotransfer) domain-containing protein
MNSFTIASMNQPILDEDTLRQLIMGHIIDIPFLSDLLQIFKRDAERLLAGIENSIVLEDRIGLQNGLHALSGIAGNVSAKRLSSLCKEFNAASSSGAVKAHMDEMFSVLKNGVSDTENSLREFIDTY